MNLFPIAAAIAALALPLAAGAAATEQEAATLKTTLTPMGAEKAGNKDGSIPAWTGGHTTVPAGARDGDRRQDPFAADKPLFSISADNVDKYADRLSDGSKALLKKHKGFRIDVYPTRRTAAAPQWYYDNTLRNATRSKLVAGGMGIDSAGAGGLPFPVPKTGDEARWNAVLHWRGESSIARQKIWTVTPSGQQVLASDTEAHEQFPWNYGPQTAEKYDGLVPTYYLQTVNGPAFRAGEGLLVHHSSDYSKTPSQVWSYLAGQRRVRRAPTVGFDTPDFVASGVNFFDEVQAPLSSPERFDWKLVGKQEMFIPYNNNRMLMAKDAEVMGPQHVKPELVRWELHRVWVLESTRKAGARHAVAKRRYYIDEDSWAPALQDGWDDQGQLWRTVQLFGFAAPDIPAYVGGTCWDAFYNLLTGQYVYRCGMGDAGPQYQAVKPRGASFFAPDSLAGSGVR
ncbi:MAG: hypothetical protein K0Q43_468 [Ramlibacter sp.]|jgi:hypothetical protein|nr:hypothetical protein [Ramlibacter sp.]MDF2462233.1 hypothetical protein [Ramlibacter sp.]